MLVVLGAKYCVNQHIAHVNFSYAPINHLLHDVCTCSWSRVMQNWLAADFVTALRVTYNLQVNKTDLCMADYMFNDRMWVWQYCYGYGSEKVGGGGGVMATCPPDSAAYGTSICTGIPTHIEQSRSFREEDFL